MALEDNDAQAIAKAIADAFKEAGMGSAKGPGVDTKQAKTAKELAEQYEKLTSRIKDQTKQYGLLNTLLNKNNTVSKAVSEDLKNLDDVIKKTEDSYERSILQQKRRDLEHAAAHATNMQMLAQFTQGLGKATSMAFAGAGQFVKGLQGGSSGIELASGLMSAGLDIAGETSKTMGNAVGAAGTVLANSTNPRLKALGNIAAVTGPLIGSLGESASKLAKFGVEVLAKEVEKTVKAFHTATSSGAMFADGMTGLRNAANQAGLTVDQFAGVLQKHSTDLAALGMGVTEGAKRVGGALNAGGTQMKVSLQKLGYGFEEQAGLVAETMKDMRGSGGPLKASNAEVAAQTQRYAENLRTISAITGEDAKKKMDQVRQQANQLAFQQKLAGMDEGQRKGVLNAMANMSDMERKNFMDMVNFGAVINKEGAAAGALSQGLTNSVEGYYAAFQKGTLNEIEARKVQAANSDQIKKDMLDNTGVALAGAAGVGGLVQGLSESMGKELEFRNTWTKEAIAAAEKGVEAQKNASDKLTESVVGAETAAQNLKLALEKELTPAIGRFAEVAKEMLGAVQKQLKEMGLGGEDKKKDSENKSWLGKKWDATKQWLSEPGHISGALTTAGTAVEVAGLAADATGIGAVAGVPLNVIGGVMMGLGALAGVMGYAKGGIADGDETGYLQKLHGKELIVPMKGEGLDTSSTGYSELLNLMASTSSQGSEKSSSSSLGGLGSIMAGIANPMLGITNAIASIATAGTTSSSSTPSGDKTTITDLKDALELLNSTAKAQLDKHDEMIRHLSDNKDISERLLNASY